MKNDIDPRDEEYTENLYGDVFEYQNINIWRNEILFVYLHYKIKVI